MVMALVANKCDLEEQIQVPNEVQFQNLFHFYPRNALLMR